MQRTAIDQMIDLNREMKLAHCETKRSLGDLFTEFVKNGVDLHHQLFNPDNKKYFNDMSEFFSLNPQR
jgi:hypothetical protein